jgi:DNA (cytosine-5)-methyltransferase 1
MLPTPTGRDGGSGPGHSGREGGPNLRTAVDALLPTPQARDGDSRSRGASHPDRRKELNPKRAGQLDEVAVHLLPTPNATDAQGGPRAVPEHRTHDGVDHGPRLRDVVADQTLLPTPRATDGTKGGPNQHGSSGDLMLPSAVQPERWGRYAAAIARWAAIVGRPAPDPTEPGTKGQPRLAPRFVEWMMGADEGWVTDVPGVSRSAQLARLGNGVVPQQAAAAVLLLLPELAAALDGAA